MSGSNFSCSSKQAQQEDEGMMESDEVEDCHQDSAINLSNNSQRTCNGVDFSESEKCDIKYNSKGAVFGHSPTLRNSDLSAALMPASLHQLFQQQLAPAQLHQLLQQHQLAEASRSQLQESARHVQEQLQLVMLQQSQGGQDKGRAAALSLHQSQLMQQMQLLQRQYLLNQAGMGPAGVPGISDNNMALWDKPLTESPSSPPSYLASQSSPAFTNGLSLNVESRLTNGSVGDTDGGEEELDQTSRVSALFYNGICNWPGCETPCDDLSSFLNHLSTAHTLDDRSTAHARVQLQVVQQMETNLSKEKARLDAMMAHLHMTRSQTADLKTTLSSQSQQHTSEPISTNERGVAASGAAGTDAGFASSSAPASAVMPGNPFLRSAIIHGPSLNHGIGPIRRKNSEKPTNAGPYEDTASQQRRRVADRSGQDITEELSRNRDFYRNTDIRPPFTYASLIRQAIVESPDRQLTLNEIYSWFQATFAYFRRNAATWKNAVRHNLSLHKCFARVENVKGAVWTVDEVEFCKRRSQRSTGQSRSPTLSNSPTTLYGDSLNLSIQSALGDVKIPFMMAGAERLRDTPTLLSVTRNNCDSPPLSPRAASEGGTVTSARDMYSPGLLGKHDYDSPCSPNSLTNTAKANLCATPDPNRRLSLDQSAEDLRMSNVKVEYSDGDHTLPTSTPA